MFFGEGWFIRSGCAVAVTLLKEPVSLCSKWLSHHNVLGFKWDGNCFNQHFAHVKFKNIFVIFCLIHIFLTLRIYIIFAFFPCIIEAICVYGGDIT